MILPDDDDAPIPFPEPDPAFHFVLFDAALPNPHGNLALPAADEFHFSTSFGNDPHGQFGEIDEAFVPSGGQAQLMDEPLNPFRIELLSSYGAQPAPDTVADKVLIDTEDPDAFDALLL